MTDLLIRNATVLHIAKDRPEITLLPGHDLLIQGRRIQAVQPTGQADPSHFRAVIAADGLLARPGRRCNHRKVVQ